MSSPDKSFRRELRSLRSQMIAAVASTSIGDFEDGLEMYGKLVRAVLQHFKELGAEFGVGPASSLFNPYGVEMDWLENDIRALGLEVSRSDDRELSDEFLSFLRDILNDFLKAGELRAHQQFLSVALAIQCESMLGHVQRPLCTRLPQAIHLYGVYRVPETARSTAGDAPQEAVSQVTDTLFEILRCGLQTSDDAAALAASEVRSYLEDLEFVRWGGPTGKQHDLRTGTLRRARALALGSASLTRLFEERKIVESARAEIVRREVRQALPDDELWQAYVDASDDYGRGFPWSGWEMDLRPSGQRVGSLGALRSALEDEVTDRLLAEGWILDAEAVLDQLEPALSMVLVKRLGDRLDHRSVNQALGDVPSARVERLRQDFKSLEDAYADRDEERREKNPIDESRVAAFFDAVASRWEVGTVLSSHLRTRIDEGTRSEVLLGSSQVATKDYFSTSESSWDPTDFGEARGRALAAGEARLIAEELQKLVAEKVSLHDLVSRVRGLVRDCRHRGIDPVVLLLRSRRGYRQLLPELGPSEVPEFDGAPLSEQYVGDTPLCVVGDLGGGMAVQRWTLSPQREEDTTRSRSLLRGSVTDITPDVAAEMIRNNREFRRGSDGTFISSDSALKRLRNSVVVTFETTFVPQVVDASSIVVLEIDEDEP